MVQSGGGFLPDIANIFPDEGQAGSIMYNQVKMSAENIAQIAIVHGPSTAGGAYIPALCDEVVIVRNQGAMFLGSPQLVFAATGETHRSRIARRRGDAQPDQRRYRPYRRE